MARIAVHAIGDDVEDAFAIEEKKAGQWDITVFQAWLNLSQPWAGRAVDHLRRIGYFLGGVLPRWFDYDGLLMIKTHHRPYWEEMQIHFDRAKEIVRLVREDWKAVSLSGFTGPEA